MLFGPKRTTKSIRDQRACKGLMESLHISEESWGRNQTEQEGMEVAPTPTPVSKPRPTSLGLLYSSSQLVRRLRNIQAQGALRLPSATVIQVDWPRLCDSQPLAPTGHSVFVSLLPSNSRRSYLKAKQPNLKIKDAVETEEDLHHHVFGLRFVKLFCFDFKTRKTETLVSQLVS